MGNDAMPIGPDPVVPRLEAETRRRRRRPMFHRQRIPVRLMVPNFFTLLGLCAGLTSIRMGLEGRYELALAAIVFAALLDGIDGRVARLLKASSRFGAELDSLADFVNFGVAPAFLIYNWGLGGFKSGGWICVMIFALASALRLARFNMALDEDRPRWQSNYFMGMPTPAAAIVVLLPFYLQRVGIVDARASSFLLQLSLLYTLVIAVLMVSAIPTFSGKLLGERIAREWVLPMFVAAIGFVAMLLTYPYVTLTIASLVYLAFIPVSWKRFQQLALASEGTTASGAAVPGASAKEPAPSGHAPPGVPPAEPPVPPFPTETKH